MGSLHSSTPPFAISVSLKPMPLLAGAGADSQQRQNGNSLLVRKHRSGIFWIRGDYIPPSRLERVLTSYSGTAGNGLPALTRAIQDTSLFQGQWANTMESLRAHR